VLFHQLGVEEWVELVREKPLPAEPEELVQLVREEGEAGEHPEGYQAWVVP
jgi:hypothetical protein